MTCGLPWAALIAGVFLGAPGEPQDAWDWKTATPESQGMSSSKLDLLRDELARRKTRAFLVVRNDQIVYEWYAPGQGVGKTQGTASLAKALVGGLSLGVAVTDGRIHIDDPAASFIPEWKEDPRKSRITIRHLGSHTSGLSDAETPGVKHEDQASWMGGFWKRLPPPKDPFTLARDKTPMVHDPGQAFQYSNPGIGMLTYCVTAALKDAPDKDVRSLLKNRILGPLGVPDAEWSVGYATTFTVGGLPLIASWGGASFTPRAAARIGRLVLREGDWNGRRLLSREAVGQITRDAGLPGNCGMGWWTNASGRYPWLPKDAVWGAGAGDQVLLVVPSLGLILVRNGETLPTPAELRDLNPKDVFEQYHDPRANILFEPVIGALTAGQAKSSAPPYPASRVITRLDWAPKETILRKAEDSDNWPITWGDDDLLYTAYGDGYGFKPFVPEKLSMGLATVKGSPQDFEGVNLRSETAEFKGGGRAGRKASGILMVDGVLYLLARNLDNSQLAWSADHGRSWTWSDWKFSTSFGCPTFLNFGRNYAGARDSYVYIYSQDHASAYQAADRMVLARVPKDRIRERPAYEFFTGLDAGNQPLWSRDIAARGAVFAYPNRCFRSAVTYSAALRRVLWVQIIPGPEGTKRDTRFEGGLAIYDAPEPWGPWTTAYFSEHWDVGPGDTASFPAKWMSGDGKTLHLVFSCEDSFSVRRADLVLGPSASR